MSLPAGPDYDLVDVRRAHWPASLRHEHVPRLGVVTTKATQGAHLLLAERMVRRSAVLRPDDAQQSLLEVDLIPAQRHELTDAQAVPVRDRKQRRVAMPVAAGSRSGAD